MMGPFIYDLNFSLGLIWVLMQQNHFTSYLPLLQNKPIIMPCTIPCTIPCKASCKERKRGGDGKEPRHFAKFI